MGPAQRAIRIAADTDLAKPHGKRIVHQQTSDQGFSLLHDEFNRLGRLYHSNNPGQNSQDTGLTSRRHHTRRGWGGEQAAVAWANMRLEHTGLPFKLENAAMHYRLAGEESGIVDQIARRKVIAAVDDDVIVLKDSHDIIHRQTLVIEAHLHVRIKRVDRLLGRFGLRHANAVSTV